MTRCLDSITLLNDPPAYGLEKCDMGAVVMVHDGVKAFEVGCLRLARNTLGVRKSTGWKMRCGRIFGCWGMTCSLCDKSHMRILT